MLFLWKNLDISIKHCPAKNIHFTCKKCNNDIKSKFYSTIEDGILPEFCSKCKTDDMFKIKKCIVEICRMIKYCKMDINNTDTIKDFDYNYSTYIKKNKDPENKRPCICGKSDIKKWIKIKIKFKNNGIPIPCIFGGNCYDHFIHNEIEKLKEFESKYKKSKNKKRSYNKNSFEQIMNKWLHEYTIEDMIEFLRRVDNRYMTYKKVKDNLQKIIDEDCKKN